MTRQQSAQITFAIVLVTLLSSATLAQQFASQPSGESSALRAARDRARVGAGSLFRLPTASGFAESSVQKSALAAPSALGTSFLPAATYTAGCSPRTTAVGDLDGDGHPDLVVSNDYQDCTGVFSEGEVSVLLGNGDGSFRAPSHYSSAGIQALSLAIGDLNGDGRLDVVVVNSCASLDSRGICAGNAYGSVGVLLGNGDGTFRVAVAYSSGGENANSVVIADVNNDGHPDVVVGNSGSVAVLLGNGDGTFQSAVNYPAGGDQGVVSLADGDLNDDGNVDLVVVGGQDVGVVSVLLANGDGTFRPQVNYNWGGYLPNNVAIADLNGDGHPDLVVASYCQDLLGACNRGSLGVMLGNGDGSFQPPVAYSSGGFEAFFVAVGDVNSDGRADLIVSSVDPLGPSSLGPEEVGVLLGNGDGTFQPAVSYLSGGYGSHSVVLADVNDDGKPDVLVTNICDAFSRCDGTTQGVVSVLLNDNGAQQFPTTTTASSNLNPSSFGQLVTLTASVTSGSGTPSGRVLFFDATAAVTMLGSASVVNGVASLPISTLATGTRLIAAVYQGSVEFNFSTSSLLQQTVEKAIVQTTIALTSSLNPAVVGNLVTIRAALSSSAGPPPDGEMVTFFKGSNVLGFAPLNAGVAVITNSSFKVPGLFTIKAVYGGDSSFKGSTSSLLEIVNGQDQSPTATSLFSTLNPSIYGQKVTWTAKVTSTVPGAVTGRVNFRVNGIGIGTAPLDAGGVATLTFSNLNAGQYPLIAVYLGDMSNGRSASANVSQLVQQTSSAASLTSTPNPSVIGQPVTFTARITSLTVIPKGPVTFTAGKTVLGSVQLSNGKATVATSSLASGSTLVKVTYGGNSDVKGSSASVKQVVQ